MSLVQSALKQAGFTANQAINFASATTSGNLLVCFAGNGTGAAGNVTNVSDPVNGNWTELGTDAAGGTVQSVWFKVNAASVGAAQSVTIASTAGDQAIVILEEDSIATTTPQDPSTYGSTTGVATSGTSPVTNSLTTAIGTGNAMFCGSEYNGASTSATITNNGGANWSAVRVSGDSTFDAVAVYRRRLGGDAPGTYSLSISTTDGNPSCGSKFVAFQPSGGGAVDPFPVAYRHFIQRPATRPRLAR